MSDSLLTSDPAHSRRRFLHLAGLGAAAGLTLTALKPERVLGEYAWCWDDPIFAIDGKIVHVNIGIEADAQTVRRHVQNAHTVLYLPPDVPASIVGFTNVYFPETAEIRRDSKLKWVRPSPGGEKVSKVDFEAYVSFRSTKSLKATAQVVYPHKELTKNGDTTNKTIKINATVQ